MPNAPAATHALKVLRLLARHAAPLPASAIARDLELPRSSTYHLLTALEDEGFVVHLPEQRRYGLGVAAFELGSAYERQESLKWIAQTVLTRLVSATAHNAHLAVLHGRDVMYVVEERAAGRPPLVTDVGVRLPAHLTASGLAMLAALPPGQVRALFPSRAAFVQRHGVGPGPLPVLRQELSRVRREGYAHEDGSVTPGFASVAAAVLDHSGHPVAGVAVTYPVHEVAEAEPGPLAARVSVAAGELSRRIRGRATTGDPHGS